MKGISRKCYRIRENEGGQKEILEANNNDQWAIEKGLSEHYDGSFNHYFMMDNRWFVQKDIAYKYLFVDVNTRLNYGYKIEQLDFSESLDELFATLLPMENWLVYLQERLADCEMAIQSQIGDIELYQKKIKSCRDTQDGNRDQEICHYQEIITKGVQKIRQLQIEHEELKVKLRHEEGMEWGRGMRCCAEIAHLTHEELLAKFLNETR